VVMEMDGAPLEDAEPAALSKPAPRFLSREMGRDRVGTGSRTAPDRQ